MDRLGKDCTRRRFLRGSAAGAAAGMVGCGGDDHAPEHPGVPEPTDVDPRPPNIVFITLDDVGWACLPDYGNPYIETPAISGLVASGVLFERAFLVTSSCSPSRGVYLTGQYPHTSGLVGLVNRFPELAIPEDRPTLPRLLAESGYACGIQGKWHVSPEPPTHFGFDEFINDVTATTYIERASEAIDFMRRHRDGPFYLELDFVEPHWPWDPHEGLFVDPAEIDVLDYWMVPSWPEFRELAALYYGELRFVDRILAEVFAALDELDLADDTIVALASDNGVDLPGNKMTLYDRGIRTPLVVRWPSRMPAGVRSDALVSIVDLPQALAIAATGAPTPLMQGDPAFFDVLLDPTRRHRDGIYAEMTYHAHYIPARAVRTDRWKYIRNLSPDPWGLGYLEDEPWIEPLLELPGHDWLDERAPVELYDLANDPHEVNNLADDPEHAEVRADMHRRLVAFAEEVGDTAYDLDP